MDRQKEIINLVKRQTNMTEDEITEKLKVHKGNYLDVIKEYILDGKKKETVQEKHSTNQKIMGEIRNFMDDVNNQYERRKRYIARTQHLREEYAKKKALDTQLASENSIVSEPDNSTIKKNELSTIIPEKQ